MSTLHEYRVRPAADESAEVLARAVVDLVARTVTVELPDGARATVDVMAARALIMILTEAVYGSLEPDGPYLRLESHTGYGWSAGGAAAQQTG